MTGADEWESIFDLPQPATEEPRVADPYDGLTIPAPTDADVPPLPGESGYAAAVARKVNELRIVEDARALLADEKSGPRAPFDAGMLAELLARPEAPAWRVHGLIPADAGTLVVAQRKTGKTTLGLNLARCLLTGDSFLGRFPVEPVRGTVAVLNFEVSGKTFARWADEAGVPADRLFVVNLRGRRNPFSDAGDRGALASLLRSQATETVIVDPFGRAYAGASQNDAGEVGAWLGRLDSFARGDVGARDVVLAAHAGWNGERTRGSSALEDWADVVVTLTRGDGQDQARYLRAEGRDVVIDEDEVTFDAITRTLALSGVGGRVVAARSRHMSELVDAVVGVVKCQPGANGSQVAAALRDSGVPHQRGEHSQALAMAVESGRLTWTPGAHGAKCYDVAMTYPGGTSPQVSPQVTTYPDVPQTYPGGTYPPPTPTPTKGEGVGGVGQNAPERRPTPEPGSTCSECGEPLTGPGALTRCRARHRIEVAAR